MLQKKEELLWPRLQSSKSSMNKKNCHGRFVSRIAVFCMINLARVKKHKKLESSMNEKLAMAELYQKLSCFFNQILHEIC